MNCGVRVERAITEGRNIVREVLNRRFGLSLSIMGGGRRLRSNTSPDLNPSLTSLTLDGIDGTSFSFWNLMLLISMAPHPWFSSFLCVFLPHLPLPPGCPWLQECLCSPSSPPLQLSFSGTRCFLVAPVTVKLCSLCLPPWRLLL